MALETGHAAGATDSELRLAGLILTAAEQKIASDLVEKVFDIFTQWANELLDYAIKDINQNTIRHSDSQPR